MNDEKLSKFLSERLVNIFATVFKETPAHLIGLDYHNLYKIKGFGYAAFHELAKKLWLMGLHFDERGTIQPNKNLPNVRITQARGTKR